MGWSIQWRNWVYLMVKHLDHHLSSLFVHHILVVYLYKLMQEEKVCIKSVTWQGTPSASPSWISSTITWIVSLTVIISLSPPWTQLAA